MSQKLKVLISTYACAPDEGSEPGVGWNWIQQMAQHHEVWVLTLNSNREKIEEELLENPIPNVHWEYFDSPWWMRLFEIKSISRHKKITRYYYYYVWQIAAYFVARRLHKQHKFDIAHHVTYGGYWLPTYLAFLPIPFILGPVGGGDNMPVAFYKTLHLKARIIEYLRTVLRAFAEYDPALRLAIRRTAVTVATTPATAKRLEALHSKRIVLMTSVAMERDVISQMKEIPAPADGPIRFVSVGRMLHWKGFHLGLAAFTRYLKTHPDSEYLFIGDGGELNHLKKLAARWGVEEKARFFGNIPRREALEHISHSHVLLHPSLHESAGMVITEAMAASRPVICLDLGGPALLVEDGITGFKVQAGTPEQTINDLEKAMATLAEDPELRLRMGKAGQKRVEEQFTWEKHSAVMRQMYAELTQQEMHSPSLQDNRV